MTTADVSGVAIAIGDGPEMDHLGRYVFPDPATGERRSWTRVTTFAKVLADTYNLEAWKRRNVAVGLAGRPNLYHAARVATASGDKKALNQVCDEAMAAAGANAGREHGTAMHSIIERINRGEDPEIPEHMAGDVQAYRVALADAGIGIATRYVERRIINTTHGLAGTFDGLATYPDNPPLVVFDLKTAATMDHSWLETAIQLAAYANATQLLTTDLAAYDAMPEIDRATALVAHVPAGKGRCDIYEVDIARGWAYAELCRDVRAARRSARGLARQYLANR